VDLMSIGEFARLSRLSAKALRLYYELGLLPPAQVDPDSGYRWYAAGQLDNARLAQQDQPAEHADHDQAQQTDGREPRSCLNLLAKRNCSSAPCAEF
jgi:DNA-binding transcriptional MerR regulator